MFVKKLAELFVRLGILVDAVSLHIVCLNLEDLLLGRQALRVGCVLGIQYSMGSTVNV